MPVPWPWPAPLHLWKWASSYTVAIGSQYPVGRRLAQGQHRSWPCREAGCPQQPVRHWKIQPGVQKPSTPPARSHGILTPALADCTEPHCQSISACWPWALSSPLQAPALQPPLSQGQALGLRPRICLPAGSPLVLPPPQGCRPLGTPLPHSHRFPFLETSPLFIPSSAKL